MDIIEKENITRNMLNYLSCGTTEPFLLKAQFELYNVYMLF